MVQYFSPSCLGTADLHVVNMYEKILIHCNMVAINYCFYEDKVEGNVPVLKFVYENYLKTKVVLVSMSSLSPLPCKVTLLTPH